MRSRLSWSAPWARALLVPACFIYALLSPAGAHAQSPELREVLLRLDRLENQNRELMDELRALRQRLGAQPGTPPAGADTAAAPPGAPLLAQGATPGAPQALPLEERVDVQEQRIAQMEQSKVSSEHRLPVTLTGMALFNGFLNGRGSGGADNPTIASPFLRQADGGATFRQTVLGLKFDGPDLQGGGKLTGSIYMDFFGGGTGLNQTMRLRVASLDATWRSTTLTFAFDKPVIAPREPDSLAQVGVSPLTAAGNLWLWQPQARVEQRFALGDKAGLRAQFGVYQTSEAGTGLGASEYSATLARSRPGYEGRFELWANNGEHRRIEIAPGFHYSDTHVAGQTVPSRIFSIDWLIRPASRIDLIGTFFQGENVGVVGGLRQGVDITNGQAHAVHATGGWAQLKVRIAPRLSMNVYGGQESDRLRDFDSGGISRNLGYAANIMYRLGTNILTGFEASQVRTTYQGIGTRLNQHYDLAIAYLF